MPTSQVLSAAVGSGRGATNRAADVRTVQHLFNLLDGSAGLPEDGRSSGALVGRIVRFQRDVLRYPHPDGRVDPNGRTLNILLARANGAARSRNAAEAERGESWGQWASSHLDALRRSMAGAVRGSGRTGCR